MRRHHRVAAVTLLVAAATVLAAVPAVGEPSGRIAHVQSTKDGVELLFAVEDLPDGAAPDLDSVTVTVDGELVEARASSVTDSAEPVERTAVLTIDVSNSMRGEPFKAAKAAAHTYLDTAPADVSVGLVTFANDPRVVSRPIDDRAVLHSAVDGLELRPKTGLYDGIAEALEVTGSDGLRKVLVLSDGRDTASELRHDALVDRVRRSGADLDVVALGQTPADRALLSQLARAGGGEVFDAADTTELARVFAQEAEALADQVLVRFPPPRSSSGEDATVEVSLTADGTTYTDATLTHLAAPEPNRDAETGLPVAEPDPFVLGKDWLLGGIAALGVGLAALLIILLAGGKPKDREGAVTRKLAVYTLTGRAIRKAEEQKTTLGTAQVKQSAVRMADRVVARRDFESVLGGRLEAAGVSFRPAEWLLIHVGITVGLSLLAMLLTGQDIIATAVGLAVGGLLPVGYLRFKASRRVAAFNSQLADTLQLMSGSLSAGYSLPQAVDTVVREGSEPIAGEFRRAIIEQRLGVPVEDALDGIANRMSSKDFRWIVMAIRIQREVGGNLAELLNTVADTLREREYLRRQVKTLSAEGKLSAWILGGLPPLFAIYLLLVRRDYIEPMYTTVLGGIMIGIATVMLTIGGLWLRKVVRVEV